MSQEPKRLVLSAEDEAKVSRARARLESAKISPEWHFVGRFGYYFGWNGAQAIMNNEIDFDVAQTMIRSAEKIRSAEVIDMANAMYVASVASNSKKGAKIMKQGLAGYVKNSKVDD